MIYEKRLEELHRIMDERRLDAILIPSFDGRSKDFVYLTKYHDPSLNFLVVTKDGEWLLTTEVMKAKKESRIRLCADLYETPLSEFLKKKGLDSKRIGIDGKVRYSFIIKLKSKLPGIQLEDITEDLLKTRITKSKNEVEKIREACLLSDRIMKDITDEGFTGTELQIKNSREKKMVSPGTRWSFETIVAGDANSSRIHHAPKREHIKKVALIDMGIDNGGYTSDVTRTFLIDDRNSKMLKARQALIDLHSRLSDIIEPGVSVSDIDLYARKVLEKEGYDRTNYGNFHALGHGLGLEEHELPIISEKRNGTLEKDMVIALEPAIYFPGQFGIRLEDTVVVTGTGIKRLSRYPFE